MVDIRHKRMNRPHRRPQRAGSRSGRRALPGLLLAAGLVLLPLGVVQAQGNPAFVIRALQARIATLSQMAQRQQQQIAVTNQGLQRLQTAVNAAAAVGDPTAQAVRSTSLQSMLDKLVAQFAAHARPAGTSSTAASAGELPPPDLSGAQLSGTVLRGAKLIRANLSGADLRNADLTNAALKGSSLRGAKLQGAILMGAALTDVDLKTALYDNRTRWPEGYDPVKQGALLVK
jgi:hypothetical protein